LGRSPGCKGAAVGSGGGGGAGGAAGSVEVNGRAAVVRPATEGSKGWETSAVWGPNLAVGGTEMVNFEVVAWLQHLLLQ